MLYNGVLAGVSLAGNTFFYQNPLESNGRAKRTEYFEVACCPANLARMLEQLPGLVYAQTADTIYANLYVGNHADVKLGGRTVKIVEDTRYPWDGDVSLRLEPEGSGAVHRGAAHSRLGARSAGAERSLSLRRQRRRAAGRSPSAAGTPSPSACRSTSATATSASGATGSAATRSTSPSRCPPAASSRTPA